MFKIGDVVREKLQSRWEKENPCFIVNDIMYCPHCREQYFLDSGGSRIMCNINCNCGHTIGVWGGSRNSKYFVIVDTSSENEYLKKLDKL